MNFISSDRAMVRGEAAERRRQERLRAQQEKNKIYLQRLEEAELRRTKMYNSLKKKLIFF